MILSIIRIFLALLHSWLMATLVLITIPFNREGRLFHTLARLHAHGVLALCGIRVVVRGLENVDFSHSYIYVANHASYFDIPAVIAGIPDQIRLVYKKELERLPFFGWGLKYGKTYIGIRRGTSPEALQSLDDAIQKIRNGASVLLFAEGTRTSDGKLQPFKRGAFNIAVRANVPVVPLTINGSYRILPRHSVRIRPGTITLVLDTPIIPPGANGKSAEVQLRDRVQDIIRRHYSDQ